MGIARKTKQCCLTLIGKKLKAKKATNAWKKLEPNPFFACDVFACDVANLPGSCNH
jgi:hypothetical protein